MWVGSNTFPRNCHATQFYFLFSIFSFPYGFHIASIANKIFIRVLIMSDFSGLSSMNTGLPTANTIAILNNNNNSGNNNASATNATNNNNNSVLKNNNVNGSAETLCASRGEQPDPDFIKMFVGQVPKSMDEDQLREMFEEFGRVHSINVLRDKVTGVSKGK